MATTNAYSLRISPDRGYVEILLNGEVIVFIPIDISLHPNEEIEHLKRLIQLANVALLDG